MRIFVYEHITALGLGRDPASPEHSLYREGRAMRDAVAEDFARIPGVDVITVPIVPNEDEWIREAVAHSDWQLIIAPEFDGILMRLVQKFEALGGNPLTPTSSAVALTSDKLRLAEHWREHGVRTPATSDREPTVCEVFPLVWKPRDGAGSTATFRLERSTDVVRCRAQLAAEGYAGEMIMQEFVPGQAASLAFLTGPGVSIPLAPCLQNLSTDGRFKYLGGEGPLAPELAARAIRLGEKALTCLTGLRGWIGIDLVLGDAADGSRDFAIEVNPRLTTSYVGLRVLAESNLAEVMLQAAAGESPTVSWKPGRVRFEPDGSVANDP